MDCGKSLKPLPLESGEVQSQIYKKHPLLAGMATLVVYGEKGAHKDFRSM